MGRMTICIPLCNPSLCLRTFVKGTIRYNRIVPFDFWRHCNCKGCLWAPRECWRMCKKPLSMFLATVRRCKRPSVFALMCKCNRKLAQPYVVRFGFSDPLCARMIHMHRTISTLLRILELTRGLPHADRRRRWQFLLALTQGLRTPLCKENWECNCPVSCIQHLDSF